MNPQSAAPVVPLLSGREWKPAYETEDGDRVELFCDRLRPCFAQFASGDLANFPCGLPRRPSRASRPDL